jgi:hypothetical protein
MAEIWFGIGDYEVQMDLREPGLSLVIPKPGVLVHRDKPIDPSDEEEDSWTFDLAPRDRGEPFSNSHVWEYLATFMWVDPNTQDEVECNLHLSVCRDVGNGWGICTYPEGGSGSLILLPIVVSESLEEVYASLPPDGWSSPPYVLLGGLC